MMVCSRCPRETRYYQNVLKKRCFRKLKNNVWETKWKWLWYEKAVGHHRRKMLMKYFQAWIIYSNKSFVKRVNKRFSESFYRDKVMSRVLAAFKRNVERNRSMIETFNKKIAWNLKMVVWHKWKHYTLMRLKVEKVKNLADRIRRDRLTIRFLYAWFVRFQEKLYLQDADLKAKNKWQSSLCRKYFVFWTIFTRLETAKREKNQLSVLRYKEILRSRCFNAWIRYCRQKKILKMISENVMKRRESDFILKYLKEWKEKYERSYLKREIRSEELAVRFCRRKILGKYFGKLKRAKEWTRFVEEKAQEFQVRTSRIFVIFYLNLWARRRKELLHWRNLNERAEEWRHIYLMELFLGEMIQRVEEKREEADRDVQVVKYANSVVLGKVFKIWKEMAHRKILIKKMLEHSRKFYRDKLLKKILGALSRHAGMKKLKRIAMEYRRIFILEKVFNAWRILLHKKKILLEKVLEMNNYRRLKMLRITFKAFENQLLTRKTYQKLAVKFHDRTILSRTFRTWRKGFQRRCSNNLVLTRNIDVLRDITVRSFLLKWKEIYWHKRTLYDKADIIKRQRETRLKSQVLQEWHGFVQKHRDIRSAEGWFPELRSFILMESHIYHLIEALHRRRTMKTLETLATKTEETFIQRKYFKRWMSFVTWKKETVSKFAFCHRKSSSLGLTKIQKSVHKNGSFSRRQPMIPDYLKTVPNYKESDGLFSSERNDLTYTIMEPINRRLPVVEQNGGFVSFDA